MQFPAPITVKTLAERLDADLLGDDSLLATGLNEIHHVSPGDITFVDHPKYYQKALESAATIILIDKPTEVPAGKALLVVAEPFRAYNQLAREFRPLRPLRDNIHPSAQIGENTIIEPGVVIGPDVVIGDHCHLHANVYIGEYSRIGNHVIIQPGTVIGSDAFYFKKTADGYQKWRATGRVIIEDAADIGANCTINRGVSSDTIIGAGTKLDCLVQIGHDVKIGKNCLFASQVGVAGNTTIEDDVVLYGQVGVVQNLTIGQGAVVLGQSGVGKTLPGGKTYFGSPCVEARTAYKEMAALRHLPVFFNEYYH
ncbi:MAG: UDP-3-O-(3-hydroxymyristoyl)glucosamine N-acyltransferase [Lewinella sp.]|nr:UDP-3-O-(3-hydroxymyristoyl)glucosamine N-acyltransferase [Lewinella sp.]